VVKELLEDQLNILIGGPILVELVEQGVCSLARKGEVRWRRRASYKEVSTMGAKTLEICFLEAKGTAGGRKSAVGSKLLRHDADALALNYFLPYFCEINAC
jgi:hypothetical protein